MLELYKQKNPKAIEALAKENGFSCSMSEIREAILKNIDIDIDDEDFEISAFGKDESFNQ